MAEIGKRKKRGARLYEIPGIEATRPQCGEKSVAEIGKRKKRGARQYEIPGIEATRPQCAVIMRKDPI